MTQRIQPSKVSVDDCIGYFDEMVNHPNIKAKVNRDVAAMVRYINLFPKKQPQISINKEIADTINECRCPIELEILISDNMRNGIITIYNCYNNQPDHIVCDKRFNIRMQIKEVLYMCAEPYAYIMRLRELENGLKKGVENQVKIGSISQMERYTDADSVTLGVILKYHQLPAYRNGERYIWKGSNADAVRFYKAFGLTSTEWNRIFLTKHNQTIMDSFCKCREGYQSGCYKYFNDIKNILESQG